MNARLLSNEVRDRGSSRPITIDVELVDAMLPTELEKSLPERIRGSQLWKRDDLECASEVTRPQVRDTSGQEATPFRDTDEPRLASESAPRFDIGWSGKRIRR